MLPGIQSQLQVLSGLEIQLQKAALLENDKAFINILDTIKRIFKGHIPKEKVRQLFHNEHISLLASLIAKPDLAKQNKFEDETPTAKIIYEILNVLKDAEVNIDNLTNVEKIFIVQAPTLGSNSSQIRVDPSNLAPPPYHSIQEWATANNAGKVFNHPLIQQSIYKEQIHDLFCIGDVQAARQLYANVKDDLPLKERRIFNIDLALRLFTQGRAHSIHANAQGPRLPNYIIDKLFTNLLDLDHVGFYEKNYPHVYPINLFHIVKNNNQFVKTQQSLTFKLYNAVLTLEKTQVDNQITLMAYELLDDYFDSIIGSEKSTACASDLLAFAFEQWAKQGPVNLVMKEERKSIVKYLLEKGARMKSLASHYQQLIFLDAGQSELFVYLGVTEPFEKLSYQNTLSRINEQKQLINQAFSSVSTNANSVQIPDPIILRALCKSASTQCFVANELVPMIALLTPNHIPPLDAHAKQAIALSIRYILEYDLIADLDSIQLGAYPLATLDPETGAPYDLYQLIMDDVQLQTGYLMALRDEELLANFSLIKALISKESHTKEELERLEKLTVPIQQGEHQNTLPNVRDFLRKHPEFSTGFMGNHDSSDFVSPISLAKSTLRQVSKLSVTKEKIRLKSKKEAVIPKSSK
ncbi:MAG: hypothetical protein JSS07_10020 [Proteobacteria bacterium]|nr:hypothetical protein [Pseudomonadota bacterium]